MRADGVNNLSTVLFRRITLEDVRLKDGTELPRGVEVNIPNVHMRDEAAYYEAGRFKGARFFIPRSQPGNETKHQYVTTDVDSLGFGHGQHACPGRFFASNEMKLMIAHLLMKYDWQFKDGCRPDDAWIADQVVLDHTAQIL